MKLKVLGSSSKGNCYLLDNNDECLIIEAGIHPKHVKQSLNFKTNKIKGVIISHSHGDHAKYVRDYSMMGIDIHASKDTFSELKINIGLCHKSKPIEHKQIFNVGRFKIMPFELKHDVKCFGFYINHPDTGNIVFATDTYIIPYSFDNVSHYIIEANYSKAIMEDNLNQRTIKDFVRNRVIKSHMSLEYTATYLQNRDLSDVKNIVLIHLSGYNSNATDFKRHIEGITAKSTFIARTGIEINFKKDIF